MNCTRTIEKEKDPKTIRTIYTLRCSVHGILHRTMLDPRDPIADIMNHLDEVWCDHQRLYPLTSEERKP